MLPMKESGLSLKEKNTQHCFFLLENCPRVLWITLNILLLTISVYDDLAVGSSSVVYISHKGFYNM